MSTLNVAALQDVDGAGSKATLPITGSNFTLGPGWGAWEFVSGNDISAATNLDITGFATGYDYHVSIQGGRPATDGVNLLARLSQSTTFNTGSSYGDSRAANSTSIRIGGNVFGNASTEAIGMDIIIQEPNVGSRQKFVLASHSMASYTDGLVYDAGHAGGSFIANENAVDGIRLFFSSGDWTANGKCYVFRRRLS